MANLKSLNTLAKKDNLVLIHGNGYFYWWGLTEEVEDKCAWLNTTSIYVNRFKDYKYERWLEELDVIKERLVEASKELSEVTQTSKFKKYINNNGL